MAGFPVVLSDRGAPFVAVEKGAPLATIAANGRGLPIRVVEKGAPPLIIQGYNVWSPADLFENGEFGTWYDPSFLDTLFQDANGTTPAVPGSPVGLVLDKSGNSRNLSQPTTAARPTLQPPGLRFDLADDNLTTTLPQAVNGDILIAGTKGSIIEPVSYAAGSTLTLGPDTYTGGTPGIMRAIGDIVGVVLIDRTLTQTERDVLIEYYKGKGAKGLLVPGPELVVNGDFSDGLNGWSDEPFSSFLQPDTFEVVGGNLHISAPEDAAGCFSSEQPIPVSPGAVYKVHIPVAASARTDLRFGPTRGSSSVFLQLQYQSSAINGNPFAIQIPSGVTQMFISSNTFVITPDYASFDFISVRELRPQEDWT